MIPTNTIIRSFIICVLGLFLSGWSLASSASAATIVVTTDQDVDSSFDADNPCGFGSVSDLPGADGLVSLREAIIAANNTPGEKSITFAPNLSGATIVLTAPLYLCGGHTSLNGDVNGDDTPDITIDGAAVTFPFDVIGIVSSHNTVKSLRVLALPNCGERGAISITTTLDVATTVTDNTIAHNSLNCMIMVGAGFDEFHGGQSINNVTIKHTRVQNNTVSGSLLFGILTFSFGDQNAITDLAITGNTVSGTEGRAIRVTGGWPNFYVPDDGASDNLTEVTIKDNLLTGNSVGPGNVAGIFITASSNNYNLGTRNQVYAQLLNNRITDNTGAGIIAAASEVEGGADNYLDVTIKGNTITGNSNPGDTAGIGILGGLFLSPSSQVNAQILSNTIADNNGNGITVGSGFENSSHNDVAVTIRDNTLENNAGVGILTYGGIGALVFPSGNSSNNILDTRIERNTVKNSSLFGIWVFGGLGSFDGAPTKVANNNEVTAVIKDNMVTGTLGEGMLLSAGASGVANTNSIEMTVKKNTVCGSAVVDIHAIGGFLGIPSLLPPNQGTENMVAGKITKNTADSVVVEDGVAGNVVDVTQFKNDACP
ncbi:MAG: right-handed parallel beta-helix repeat-containing protein [Candidatus Binatia bacterium]